VTTEQNNQRKHGKTVKAAFGQYGRTEIAIVGTPCTAIKQMAGDIIRELSNFHVAYVDADHQADAEDKPNMLRLGAQFQATDKIDYYRLDMALPPNGHQLKHYFNDYDLVLVNGNHARANTQIAVIDVRKPLENKLDRLDNVCSFVLAEGTTEIPDYLKAHVKDPDVMPVFMINNIPRIANYIRDLLILNTPPLHGLVLAGGRSERMGQDKSLMQYHGMPQRAFLLQQLEPFVAETHLSGREEQRDEVENARFIGDTFTGLGPFGAILSAFRHNPNVAWLVMACDLPLISDCSIAQLIEARNPSMMATAFYNPESDLPEPLIAIWEPKSYPHLLHYLSLGHACPRFVLHNSRYQRVKPAHPEELHNVNTPGQAEDVKKRL
jgi:molybdopterin-guanine dinucleotide biosynthesis protein A